MTATPAGGRRASFQVDGYLPPFGLLDAGACRQLVSHAPIAPVGPLSPGWAKAFAASDAMLHDVGSDPRLVTLLRSLLGDAIILWGVSIVTRVPGEIHSWHSDVESMRPEGGFASVWIGIENTSSDAALNMISGSHRVGRSIQELLHAEGLSRADASEERLLSWARAAVPEAAMVVPEMADGDAVVFDGRLWHGTRNRRRTGTRKALLLQYAVSDAPVHTPKTFDWPVAFGEERPPVVVVSGQPHAANFVVPPPPRMFPRAAPMAARFNDASALFGKQTEWWSYYPDFNGSTANLRHVTGHVSVLAPGATPHPPHVHQEEEILLVLDGEAEIVHPRPAGDGQPELHRLGPGAFAYTPAWRPHTLRNPSAERSVTYLAYKWAGRARAARDAMPSQVVRPDWTTPLHGAGFRTRQVFEGATGYLARLHAHITELDPEAGYHAHADGHDVAIVVLSGRIKVRRRAIGRGGMVFLPAGVRHGMKNPGDGLARYLVIEFHAPETERRLPSPSARLIHALRTRRWPGRAVAGRIYRGLGQLGPRGTNSP